MIRKFYDMLIDGGGMKNMYESAEAFEAYATIDCCYFLLNELKKKISTPQSQIATMVDKATGYDKEKEKINITKAIDLINQIIESKKLIRANYTADLNFRFNLSAMLNKEQEVQASVATDDDSKTDDEKQK